MEQSQLRILQIAHGFPPEFIGGTEHYCQALTTMLHRRGHTCFVLAGSYASAKSSDCVTTNEAGFQVTRYVSPFWPSWRERQYDSSNPEAEHLIKHYLQLIQPEVIHLHHWIRLTNNIVSIAAELGLPTVVTLHDLWVTCARVHRQHKRGYFCQDLPTPALCARCVERPVWQSEEEIRQALAFRQLQMGEELRLAQLLIVPSDSHRQLLSRLLGLDTDRFRVVPNGTITQLQPPTDTHAQRFPARRLRLAYWGYLARLKGVHLILEAVHRLPHPTEVEVYIAGLEAEPHYLDSLKKQAEGLAVTFVGEYRPDDLSRLDVDMVVLPSLAAESYGFVLDEAFQLGLPAIVSDRGVLASRVGEAGLVFPTGSAEGLARRIQDILETPSVLESLRQHIPPTPSPPMEKHAQTLEEIYEEVRRRPVERRDNGTMVQIDLRLQHFQRQIHDRDRDLHTLTADVQQHREALADHKALITQYTDVVQQQDVALRQHQEVVQQQDVALRQHQEVVQQQDVALRQHQEVVQQQDVALRQHQEVVQQQDVALRQHQEVVQQQDVALRQHQEVVQQQDVALRQHQEVVQQQDVALRQHQEVVQQQDVALRQHQEVVQQQDGALQTLQSQLHEEGYRTQALEDALHRIYGSMGWRVLSRFYFVRERLVAPPGTRRGRLYHKLKRVGEIYASGGWRAVLTKLREYPKLKRVGEIYASGGWRAVLTKLREYPKLKRVGEIYASGGWRAVLTKLREYPKRPLAPPLDSYQVWLAQHTVTPEQLHQQRSEMTTFSFQPTVSILMPVYNTHKPWLRRAVTSVQNQVYPHWELCICDDGSSQTAIHDLLNEFSQHDPRIHVSFSPTNEGIAAASNHALQLATGEFVGLLDHDDELSPHALFEVVKYLNAHPDTDLVYSDEDKIDPQGQRVQPFFKPDWCPDMLLAFMYTCHFSVYRRERLTEVGGFDPGCDGSQDYDLALKVTERTDAIGHIPQVLYHWRIVPGSVAERATNKLYAYEAGKRSLTAALKRREIVGSVEDTFGKKEGLGFYRIKRACDTAPLVSIIIPTRDRLELLSRCIASIEEYTTYPNYEIVIVDNDSIEPQTQTYFQQASHQVISYPGDFHFSRMMNAAARQVSGEQLLFLNNDMEVLNAGWLEALVEHAGRPEVGAVGAKLLYPNHTVQHAGVVIGLCEFAGHSHRHLSGFQHGYWGSVDIIRNYSAVTAACMMLRRSLFAEVGGFVEAFQYAYQDVDLCLRLRERGLLIVYTPYAQLVHYESASRGGAMAFGEHDIALARERWPQHLTQGDPYYSPHLTQRGEDFSLNVETNGAL